MVRKVVPRPRLGGGLVVLPQQDSCLRSGYYPTVPGHHCASVQATGKTASEEFPGLAFCLLEKLHSPAPAAL